MHQTTKTFIIRSSNEKKLSEFRRYGLDIIAEKGADLPEVDGTPEQVITYKSLAAGENVIVEDTSLDIEGFDAGVNIKWTLQKIVTAAQLGDPQKKYRATWRVMLACQQDGSLHIAQAEVHGTVNAIAKGGGFSFDAYFTPDGSRLTLGEMDNLGLKDQVSARKMAVVNLIEGNHKVVPVASVPAWTGPYQNDALGAGPA